MVITYRVTERRTVVSSPHPDVIARAGRRECKSSGPARKLVFYRAQTSGVWITFLNIIKTHKIYT